MGNELRDKVKAAQYNNNPILTPAQKKTRGVLDAAFGEPEKSKPRDEGKNLPKGWKSYYKDDPEFGKLFIAEDPDGRKFYNYGGELRPIETLSRKDKPQAAQGGASQAPAGRMDKAADYVLHWQEPKERKYDPEVEEYQHMLAAAGYSLDPTGKWENKGIDGYFGDDTKKTVKQFQYDAGLRVTGQIDKETREYLKKLYEKNPGKAGLISGSPGLLTER